MNVASLIKALEHMPQDAQVTMLINDVTGRIEPLSGVFNAAEIGTVQLMWESPQLCLVATGDDSAENVDLTDGAFFVTKPDGNAFATWDANDAREAKAKGWRVTPNPDWK
jgi:hypothetical protein